MSYKYKIYFTCPWESSDSLLNKLQLNTPSNKGVWKNITGVNNIIDHDYMVVLDDIHISLLNMGPEYFKNVVKNLDRIIYFQRENTSILKMNKKSWFQRQIIPNLKHNYSYEDDFFYTFTGAFFLNKTYDELKAMEYPSKTKNISCIISNKNLGITYQNRINFITKFSNNYKIDVFGRGWKNEFGNNYKGELGSYHQETNKATSKLDGLSSYNYSICLENFPNEKCISEKITDCLLAWCMPIYSGPNCTNKYFPEESFHLIDINDENCYSQINNISNQQLTDKNIQAIKEARNLILDKYNIWEQIYQIVNDPIKFKIDYNYDLNLYFCHYPKTGGTYIENLLFNNHGKNPFGLDKLFKDKDINVYWLAHDIDYYKFKNPNSLLVTMVRNPLELIKSYYSHGQAGLSNILIKHNIKSFDNFIDIFTTKNVYPRFIDNYMYKNFFINDKCIFDFVLRTETLTDDFILLLSIFNIDYSSINFNLSNYDKNNYIYNEFTNIYNLQHKEERKNGLTYTIKHKQMIYNKYKFYFDFFDYII